MSDKTASFFMGNKAGADGTQSQFYASKHSQKFRQTPQFQMHMFAQALLNINKAPGGIDLKTSITQGVPGGAG